MSGSQDNPSGGQGPPRRLPGSGPPPLGSKKRPPPRGAPLRPAVPNVPARRPATPARPASGWNVRNRLLLGATLGTLIAMLGITSLMIGLKLYQRMASVAQAERSGQTAVLPSEAAPGELPRSQPGPAPTRESPQPVRPKTTGDEPVPRTEPEAEPAGDEPGKPAEQDPEKPDEEKPNKEEPNKEEPDEEKPVEEKPDVRKMVPEVPGAEGTDDAGGVFAEILGRDRRLVLPEPGAADPVELAKVRVDSPTECELSLHGMEIVFESGRTLTVEQADADNARTWTIQVKAVVSRGQPIALFSLTGQSLTFQWMTARGASRNAEQLRYCLLKLKAKGESVSCFLNKPREVDPLQLGFRSHEQSIDIPLDSHWLSRAEHLHIDLKFVNFPPHEVNQSEDLGPKEIATVHLSSLGVEPVAAPIANPRANPIANPRVNLRAESEAKPEPEFQIIEDIVQMEVWFEVGRECKLCFKTLGHPEKLGDGTDSEGDEKINSSWLTKQVNESQKFKGKAREWQNKIEAELNRVMGEKEKLARFAAMTSLTSTQRMELKSHEEKVARELRVAQDANTLNAARIEAAASTDVWLDNLRRVLKVIETDGRIEFRLYVEIENEQIALLQTSGAGGIN